MFDVEIVSCHLCIELVFLLYTKENRVIFLIDEWTTIGIHGQLYRSQCLIQTVPHWWTFQFRRHFSKNTDSTTQSATKSKSGKTEPKPNRTNCFAFFSYFGDPWQPYLIYIEKTLFPSVWLAIFHSPFRSIYCYDVRKLSNIFHISSFIK